MESPSSTLPIVVAQKQEKEETLQKMLPPGATLFLAPPQFKNCLVFLSEKCPPEHLSKMTLLGQKDLSTEELNVLWTLMKIGLGAMLLKKESILLRFMEFVEKWRDALDSQPQARLLDFCEPKFTRKAVEFFKKQYVENKTKACLKMSKEERAKQDLSPPAIDWISSLQRDDADKLLLYANFFLNEKPQPVEPAE